MFSLKRLLPRSLFGRSLLIIVTPVVLLQVVAAIIFYERHWETVTRRLTMALAGDIAMVIQMMRVFPGEGSQTFILNRALTHMDVAVTLTPGATLPEVAPPVGRSILERRLAWALESQLNRPFHIDTKGYERKVKISVQLEEGVLEVFTSRDRLFSSTTYIFIMWMVGTSIVLLAIAIFFLRNQVKPIRRLAQAAESFGKGRQVKDFKPEGAREVRQAASAFLLMQERIRRQISQRTEMLAGVGHDLRTPLTRMKLQHAMLGGSDEIASLKADVAEMERMIEAYLAFARGEGEEAPKRIELGTLLREVAASNRGKGAVIELDAGGDLEVQVRPDAFKRCVSNVVDNAVRYGKNVAIAAERRADVIEITIDDDGPGVPEDSREAAFKAFHRLEESRNPETGGVGLGLTIARDVMRSHGGDLVLGIAPMGGLRALLRLPV